VLVIRKTDVFKKWMKKLKDHIAKAHINRRIDRLEQGNPGDVEPIGEGCSEMKIHYGSGYRVYYKDTGQEIIIRVVRKLQFQNNFLKKIAVL
jgi:putative addiction module killer protein